MYYTLDEIGPNGGSDNVPDKYQVTVLFTAVNGTVSRGSAVVTLYDGNGKWAADGTGYLAAGQIPTTSPNSGYVGGSWNTQPTTSVAITAPRTFTITYEPYDPYIPDVPPYTPPTTTIPDPVTPLAPAPDTEIDDEDVPLAAPGLNSTDHFDYIKGYDDGTVRPEKYISRAEVATIFFRLMTTEYRTANWATENTFGDVKAGDWFNNAVSTSAKAGILKGYDNGVRFDPQKNITRAEFAAIAARFSSEEITQRGRFSDIQGHWAEEEIERAAASGWIKGSNGKFNPEAYITRAEVITIVNRMLDRVPDAEHLLPGMKTWSDNTPDKWYYADVQEATNSHDYDREELGVTEIWTELLPEVDWKALEEQWATAASAPAVDVAAGLTGGDKSEGETEGEDDAKTPSEGN